MKEGMSRAALEQFILAEIARSQKCPNGVSIRIEPGREGSWTVVPLAQVDTDPLCLKRIAAIAARFQVDFKLTE